MPSALLLALPLISPSLQLIFAALLLHRSPLTPLSSSTSASPYLRRRAARTLLLLPLLLARMNSLANHVDAGDTLYLNSDVVRSGAVPSLFVNGQLVVSGSGSAPVVSINGASAVSTQCGGNASYSAAVTTGAYGRRLTYAWSASGINLSSVLRTLTSVGGVDLVITYILDLATNQYVLKGQTTAPIDENSLVFIFPFSSTIDFSQTYSTRTTQFVTTICQAQTCALPSGIGQVVQLTAMYLGQPVIVYALIQPPYRPPSGGSCQCAPPSSVYCR